jgi:Zn-dependent protease with chaperone function
VDFLLRQQAARRHTRWLVVLFVVSVVVTVASVDLFFVGIWTWLAAFDAQRKGLDRPGTAPPLTLQLWPIGIALAVILGATLYKLVQLSRRGGEKVAELAGGRRLDGEAPAGAPERQLQNIVGEMAIASGVPRPEIWVLDRDPAINAFAAGDRPEEAVLAVTHGALSLPRDELQGVVAHEFSHILSGDMRLNMRLLTVVFGIRSIATIGSGIRRAARTMGLAGSDGSDNDGDGSLRKVLLFFAILPWLLGGAVWLIGSVGVLMTRLIRAAISRQREFLSDAAAVEFTRNPDGIGRALMRVAEASRSPEIPGPQSEALSHFFFVKPGGSGRWNWLGSHPPPKARLRRIYGRPV